MAIDITLNLSSLGYGLRTNSTVTEPTGATTDDILIAALYIESNTAVTTPAGWSLLYTKNDGATYNLKVYGIRRGASAPALTWSHASANTEMAIKRYTGCVTSGSFEDCTGSTNTGSGVTIIGTSISPTSSGAALILIPSVNSSGTNKFSAWASPLTERYDAAGGDLGYGDGLLTASGATGNKTITGPNDTWMSVMLALKPAAGGATVPMGAITYYLRMMGSQ